MTTLLSTQDMTFERLDNGVYLLALLAPTRATIDGVFEAFDYAASHSGDDAVARYVVVNRAAAMPPLAYFARKTYDWLRRNPAHRAARTAIVAEQDGLLTTLQGIFSLSRRLSRSPWHWKVFTLQEYDAAMAWALSETV